ncbi:hypothetical protein D4764_04G0003110 [Takifugu flavidus]|uniref:Uncharacterized protein n=1 Tax=Takifugu flavidus TaxID=433684 RepID=A0A5C6N279_9TELE|nr:hypothetical protein D4764_04G0003110 [Takifugu flavidus]
MADPTTSVRQLFMSDQDCLDTAWGSILDDEGLRKRQPVKIEPEMNGKDLLEREAVPSGPGNGSELSAITSFLLKSQQDDRKGRLAADVPDWKERNYENT